MEPLGGPDRHAARAGRVVFDRCGDRPVRHGAPAAACAGRADDRAGHSPRHDGICDDGGAGAASEPDRPWHRPARGTLGSDQACACRATAGGRDGPRQFGASCAGGTCAVRLRPVGVEPVGP
ncbi:hypothetical protein BF95_05295 [Sphingobium sp. Ant17]|nr:hypothetical protein BF95_05295 [Sphingobium sp. Ant17]